MDANDFLVMHEHMERDDREPPRGAKEPVPQVEAPDDASRVAIIPPLITILDWLDCHPA